MLISEVRENQGQRANPAPDRPCHPVVARVKAALGIMRHAVRHPLTACVINLDTGEVRPYRG